MIFAAGRGERMRPLTDTCPKPLLEAGGKPLVVWQIEKLRAAGIRDLVINVSHLGHLIQNALGDGRAWGVNIAWSPEPPGALETAGGLRQAAELLGNEPYLVANADVWCDFDLSRTLQAAKSLGDKLAHLVMVANPPHHAGGDFGLCAGQLVRAEPRYTYSGIGVFAPQLTAHLQAGTPMKLRPLLDAALDAGRLSGELHHGMWEDIGTPERLAALDAQLRNDA